MYQSVAEFKLTEMCAAIGWASSMGGRALFGPNIEPVGDVGDVWPKHISRTIVHQTSVPSFWEFVNESLELQDFIVCFIKSFRFDPT